MARNVKFEVEKWKYSLNITRREEVIITRARIGHSHLTHTDLYQQRNVICDKCQVNLTIKHIVI